MLSVLIEIEEGVKAITEQEMTRAELGMDPVEPTSTVLGVASEWARRAYTLSRRFMGERIMLTHRAEFEADSAEQRAALQAEALRAGAMADHCAELFWIEAKNEIGAAAWQSEMEVGLRVGWQIVRRKSRKMPNLHAIFGAGMPPMGGDD